MDVEVTGLSKRFVTGQGVTEAVLALDLRVASGEFLAIVGPSGSGKTTLLEMIAGLTPPTSGTVLVGGRQVTGPGRDCAMVFQEYALFPWRTVLGNLHYVLEIRQVPRSEWNARCAGLLERLALWSFRDAYPAQLSGGMKQRVALARALVGEPHVLLMDEPFAAVDAITRRHLQDLLLQILERSPKTVILVTHSIEEALLLANRVAVFTGRPGKIREILEIPGPRRGREMGSPQMGALYDHVWALLAESSSCEDRSR
jgi:NitT/TauT family transport system ATP-binding protein